LGVLVWTVLVVNIGLVAVVVIEVGVVLVFFFLLLGVMVASVAVSASCREDGWVEVFWECERAGDGG
jgi:hypothetical protein